MHHTDAPQRLFHLLLVAATHNDTSDPLLRANGLVAKQMQQELLSPLLTCKRRGDFRMQGWSIQLLFTQVMHHPCGPTHAYLSCNT